MEESFYPPKDWSLGKQGLLGPIFLTRIQGLLPI
jgi:hypothetical protein